MSSRGNRLVLRDGSIKLVDFGEWNILTLDTSDTTRLVNHENDTVIPLVSVSGNVSTFTLTGSVRSEMTSGTTFAQNSAAYFGWKVLKPDGTAYKMNENVILDLYFEFTGSGTGNQALNASQLAFGVNDGSDEFANGRYAGAVRFPNSTNPKTGTWTQGGGLTLDSATEGSQNMSMTTWTTPSNLRYPFRIIVTQTYDSDLAETTNRVNNGTSGYCGGSSPSRASDIYVFFAAGKQTYGASYLDKSFSVILAYRVLPGTYNASSSFTPGS